MSQVTYKSEKVSKKRVYYTGSDQLLEGYCLCYDRDYGTAADSDIARAYRVEKPTTANLKYFAGVVSEEDSGKTGPCWITIIEPQPCPGRLVKVYTDQDCTLGSTKLAVKDASYAAGAAGASNVTLATAMQTVDRSGTAGTVLGQLEGASSVEVDVAAAVSSLTDSTGGTTGGTTVLNDVLSTQTQSALTDSTGGTTGGTTVLDDVLAAQGSSSALAEPTGGTTGGTFALDNIPGTGYSAGEVANIEDNFTKLVDFANALRTDQASIVTAANNNLADVNAQLEAIRSDVADIITNANNNFADVNAQLNNILTALKNANLMAN